MGVPDPGPVTVTCPSCRQALPSQTEVLTQDEVAQKVILSLDVSGLRKHLQQECPGKPPTVMTSDSPAAVETWAPAHTPAELAGRVERFLAMQAFIPPNVNRWCMGCKTSADACLKALRKRKGACCAMCSEGNSHPGPGEHIDCQVWGAERGASS